MILKVCKIDPEGIDNHYATAGNAATVTAKMTDLI
jgi:hypothetical protein